jgi:hypothetical protein
VVEWLTLLLRIRDVPGSNLGPIVSRRSAVSELAHILSPNEIGHLGDKDVNETIILK